MDIVLNLLKMLCCARVLENSEVLLGGSLAHDQVGHAAIAHCAICPSGHGGCGAGAPSWFWAAVQGAPEDAGHRPPGDAARLGSDVKPHKEFGEGLHKSHMQPTLRECPSDLLIGY